MPSICSWGQGSRFKVQGSRFKVQGSGYRVQRFRVLGSRISAELLKSEPQNIE
jgi:hypothetical protein